MSAACPRHRSISESPTHCPQCAALGTVALETGITGGIARLVWWCRQCEHTWDVKRKDETISGVFPKQS